MTRPLPKSALIVEMAKRGTPTREIAAAANTRAEYVRVVKQRYLRGGGRLPALKPQSLPVYQLLPPSTRLQLDAEARRRGVPTSDLVARLLKITVRDDLFAAVLGAV